MTCERCADPEDGSSCYPVYGLGPHTHDISRTGSVVGSTVMSEQEGVDGFTPDPDEPGTGTWWCPACGEGRP